MKNCNIIYKKSTSTNDSFGLPHLNHSIFIGVTPLYIINYMLKRIMARYMLSIFSALKNERRSNMDFVVKHPHAYNFLPEPHTKFYHVSEFLTVADDLWLDGFRNCYNLYINANCWETNQLCHIVADWTHQFYEGVQYLYALHGDKLLQNVGYMVQAIDDLFRTVSLQLDTTQLDLFPELKKPKTGEVVDYRKTIYK